MMVSDWASWSILVHLMFSASQIGLMMWFNSWSERLRISLLSSPMGEMIKHCFMMVILSIKEVFRTF